MGAVAVIIGCIGAYIMKPFVKDTLQIYRKKRNFKKTTEPKGDVSKSARGKKGKKPIFVIQQHDATAMHYDFRLEIDGVLKSWAIPKGPSTNPKEKHLAIETEDHPLEYAKFEGVIPEGEYGAGPVIIWDQGTYENVKKMEGNDITMDELYKKGRIEVFLHGKKLQGAYALIKTKGMGDNKWLFFKMKDEFADARKKVTKSMPESVESGKTIKEMKKGHHEKNKSR